MSDSSLAHRRSINDAHSLTHSVPASVADAVGSDVSAGFALFRRKTKTQPKQCPTWLEIRDVDPGKELE